MYSQSRGRQFTVGQHSELLEYLLQSCPLHPGEDWQEDKKLNLILSKVQEHQQSLRETVSLPPSAGKKIKQFFKLFFFANEEFLRFSLLSKVILLSVIFFYM